MGMQQAPRPKRSPWVRYAPIIVIVVIIAVVAVALGTRDSGSKKKTNDVNVAGSADVVTMTGRALAGT